MTILELEREAGAVLPERETLSFLVFIDQKAVAVNWNSNSLFTWQSANASNFAFVA